MRAAEAIRTVCAVQQTPGFKPSAVALMLAIARETGVSLGDLPSASDADLVRLFGWRGPQVRAFRAGLDAPVDRYERLAAGGLQVSTRLDPEQPAWCDRLPSTPWFFHLGNMTLLDMPSIGFSGSRDADEAALAITRRIATAAAGQGMVVISGGARGVDMAAHCGALEAGGPTVVLVPQGLGTWSLPREFADVAATDRLLVLSEDLPWAGWATPSAMQRNRAIVDLSDVIVIPHAGTTGGSASTGQYALSRKRNLWVADLGDAAPGNQLLLQRGAKPLPHTNGVPDIEAMRSSAVPAPAQQSLF